jgi:shikimate kinase
MVNITRNIALIGFMGTGKTTIGRLLAEKLKKEFIETDSLIEDRARKTISRIFAEDGESRFRELEIEAIREAAEAEGAVISCGGGAVLNRINVDRLREKSMIILLEASPEEIFRRTSSVERPLLAGERLKEIKILLKKREPFYQNAADYRIDTTGLQVEAVLDRISKISSGVGE